jgi:hypothetical protein
LVVSLAAMKEFLLVDWKAVSLVPNSVDLTDEQLDDNWAEYSGGKLAVMTVVYLVAYLVAYLVLHLVDYLATYSVE